jgi:DNA-binding transcriptional regulator YbjK
MIKSVTRSDRMELLLGSAVQVIAEHGLRGLTHRAVDRQAGLPQGSCSAYLRTREALVLAVTEYIAECVAGHVRELATELAGQPLDDDRAAETVTRAVLRWVDEREVLVARLELTIQASRDPTLATTLGTLRNELVDAAAAETLVSAIDGVLIGALPRPETQRRAFVRRSVESLMAGLG